MNKVILSFKRIYTDVPPCWEFWATDDYRYCIQFHTCEPVGGFRIRVDQGGKNELLGIICRSKDEAISYCESLENTRH